LSTVIKVEGVGKQYRLGQVGTGSLAHDINRAWYQLRGKEDPYLKIGDTNDRTVKGTSDFVWALKNIDFEVKKGETLGFIGKNGAGKSTLLKILSQITSPTLGSVKVKGRIASLLEVGTGFHPDLTGRENVFLNGAILGMTKFEIKSKLDQIIDFSGVEKYIDTPVKRYSSGMMVRLGFAVAAYLEPEILIVDEVLAVGDSEFQNKAIKRMKEVSYGEGRTILFVSHNMVSVEAICKRAIVLNNGTIGYSGTVKEGIKNYIQSSASAEINTSLVNMNRSGNGKLKFTKVIFYDEQMNPIAAPITGKKLTIGLEYTTFSKDIKNVQAGIAINNASNGSQLTALINDISGNVFSTVPETGVFFCQLPKLTIVSGQYTLNLFCSVNGDISDWLVNFLTFNVIEGDFYQTGRNMDSGQSQFLMEYSWYCNEKN
jgi:lipopolysaccharide transport system ATP-binding protein